MRRCGLDVEQVQEAVRHYQQGESLARIGVRLDVDAETVRQALRGQDIRMRRPWEREQ
jgi:hypothetical protein